MITGRRYGLPGLALNSYSFQLVFAVSTGSSVPSKTISILTCPTLPKAPYVFTRCNRLKEVFMIWCAENILAIGEILRAATNTTSPTLDHSCARDGWADSATRVINCCRPSGSNLLSSESSKHASAGTIVSQFRNERFPL